MPEKIHRIEYDIVEHCNLNCRNCGHISQFKEKNEKSIEFIEKDITLLCTKFVVERFRITGGEPLLHTNIVGVIQILRKCLGNDTIITLVTNGIKLKSMSEHFFLALKANKIDVSISEYPISVKYEELENTLRGYHINVVTDKVSVFFNFIDKDGKQDAAESLKLCRKVFYCPFYEDGKLYLCAYVGNVPFVNKQHGYNIEYDYVSINEPVDVIMKYLTTPCSTCKYCFATRKPEPWSIERGN
jgi:hypothetical protein